MATLTYMDLREADLPDVFTHADARAAGVSNRDLSRWRDEGQIERIARGIYISPDLEIDTDLAEMAVRAAMATLCVTTALVHHGLSDEIPPVINAALPRSSRPPRTSAPVSWHRFDNATFDIGRTKLSLTEQLSISVYSPERSIIDAYRLRHLYGVDQAHQALKRWLRLPGNQPGNLMKLTKEFPTTEPILRSTFETLL